MPARLGPSGQARPPARIVHLGLGAFFRAFGCDYLAELGGWGVTGVSLRSPDIRDRLAPQDWVYTACEHGPGGPRDRVIEVVRGVLTAPEDPAAVIAALADPAAEIVTLTVTEKGYCHDPATGRLDLSHPDIAHDIASPLPRSAPGFLLRGLAARRAAGLAPFTVLSCDNLPDNGRLTRGVVLALAAEVDPGLADWIARQGAFPSSMVDRIVPATTEADRAALAARSGRHDAAPVQHEPFRQWVIEDSFAGARPALETVGAQIVADVRPFEAMKLRMLNGAHSALAYLGALAGHETVAEAVADVAVAAYLRHLWSAEIIPTLEAPPGTDLADYADRLLARFANPAIRHRTHQIAMDGSRKLPQRLLATIEAGLARGSPVEGLLLAVAGWMRYCAGANEAGAPHDVQDPIAERLAAAAGSGDPAAVVAAFLGIREVFDPALAARIGAPLTDTHAALAAHGAAAAMARVAR